MVIGCVALSFPTNWLKNFSLLSFLSVFGLLCVFLICIVVGYQLFGADAAQVSDDHTLGSVGGVPMAASIMLAGLTGHVGLPPMYCAMRRPSKFNQTLAWSFFTMCCFYVFVGSCGYALYGNGGSVLCTEDMSRSVHSVAGRVMVSLVLLGITFKLFCSVPMCVVVLTDIIENLQAEMTGRALSEEV